MLLCCMLVFEFCVCVCVLYVYLITSTNIILSSVNMYTTGDLRRLLFYSYQKIQGSPIET